MKKKVLNLITLAFCVLSVVVQAQNSNPCKLKTRLNYNISNCKVSLSDVSLLAGGKVISRLWDFGDGDTTSIKNPTHVYTVSGKYNVCLTVEVLSPNGEKCKEKSCVPIRVQGCVDPTPCKLSAKFNVKKDSCDVSFLDVSKVGTGTTITNWAWSFGDGSKDTLQNPAHTYSKSGTYTVCLTITGVNPKGVKCTDKFCLPVAVKNCTPSLCKLSPKFTFKVDSCNVKFTNTSTAGPGTTITKWSWNFGDSDTSTIKNPAHTYKGSGIYNVCLTITGKNGNLTCTEKYCFPVNVTSCKPTNACQVSASYRFKQDSCTVTFVDSSKTGPGTKITSHHWNFGDGDTSSVSSPTHKYDKSGNYIACLTVVGSNVKGEQCKDEYCFPIIVKNCNPTIPCQVRANYVYKQDSCTVIFVDSSKTGPGTTITSRHWNFGDGDTSSVTSPTHAYSKSGNYKVCLTVVGTNAKGEQCKDEKCIQLLVKDCNVSIPCQLDANFAFKQDSCTVSFTDKSVVGPGTTITKWNWKFGNGDTSSVKNPTHVYGKPGVYLACLTITGSNAKGEQCNDQLCIPIIVQNCDTTTTPPCKLTANFNSKQDRCNVSFTDASTTGTGTTITSRHWSFGDGDTSAVKNPTHVYGKSGTYTVCLTVVGSNAKGEQCKDEKCIPVIVQNCDTTTVPPCQLTAKFSYKQDSCTVSFVDSSITGKGTTIANWLWSFGDGSVSLANNPKHVYANPGTYYVCLLIEGENIKGEHCTDQICSWVVVKPCGQPIGCQITPKFGYVADSCSVSFTDSTKAGLGTLTTDPFWDFGDGTFSTLKNPTHLYSTSGKYDVCLYVIGIHPKGICQEKYCSTITVDCDRNGITTNSLQVYPNPATDVVNIGFKMEKEGQATITITDVQGRPLSVLKEGNFAEGVHNISWNVNIPAGWYLITIKTDSGIQQKQLFLTGQ